jgi:hypothetical protein
MPDATKIEFLRFGSSIPGAYWGCCCADIIQCFSGDPDAKASIQMVDGDGCSPMFIQRDGRREQAFAGPTNRDIFMQRIRVGTFGITDMPNHAFFAILTDGQCSSANGKKWLQILKETGFEFLRRVNNSVWNVNNNIFVLIRNCGPNAIKDQFEPPKYWTELPSVVPEPWEDYGHTDFPAVDYCEGKDFDTVEYTKRIKTAQKEIWDKIGPAKFLTEAEIEAAGAPVILAAKRDYTPQQDKKLREAREKAKTATPSLKNYA